MNKIIGLTIAVMSTTICCAQALACEETASKIEEPIYARYACSTATDATFIRDYPTFQPIAKLNRGECMDVVSSPVSSDSKHIDVYKGGNNLGMVQVAVYRGSEYYLVRGSSGNIRALSIQHSRLK